MKLETCMKLSITLYETCTKCLLRDQEASGMERRHHHTPSEALASLPPADWHRICQQNGMVLHMQDRHHDCSPK